jgi:hypothetical protein
MELMQGSGGYSREFFSRDRARLLQNILILFAFLMSPDHDPNFECF